MVNRFLFSLPKVWNNRSWFASPVGLINVPRDLLVFVSTQQHWMGLNQGQNNPPNTSAMHLLACLWQWLKLMQVYVRSGFFPERDYPTGGTDWPNFSVKPSLLVHLFRQHIMTCFFFYSCSFWYPVEEFHVCYFHVIDRVNQNTLSRNSKYHDTCLKTSKTEPLAPRSLDACRGDGPRGENQTPNCVISAC